MSFPRYPKYKPSGVEWLGEVPAHWEVVALKRFISMQSGEAIDAADIRDEGSVPVYGGNGVRGFTDAFTHDGDFVLVGRQGALCGNVNYASARFWASEHAVVVTPTRPTAVKWLGEMLRAMNLNQYSVSAAQPGLAVSALGPLQTALPPLPEQRAIAAFLDRETAKIDGLVAEQRRLIELLKEKRQAVISHAVTKGLDPAAPMKPSGVEWLGEVPAHWEVRRIAALFNAVVESGSAELPILSVSIHDGVSDKEMSEDELDRKVTRSEDRSKYVRVRPGDLVYNMMRAWQGAFGTVSAEGMVSPAYVVARPSAQFDTRFIELLLRTPQAIEQMRRCSKGITDFRMRLYWDEFKNLVVAVPPPRDADLILRGIADMDAEYGALEREAESAITLLQERRSALISAAVTGQIDVRNAAPGADSTEAA